MSKIRNTIIFIIILVAALVGCMKWIMHYYTEKAAKDIQQSLPPGMFKYSGISSPLNGKASIDDIVINIAGEEIKIAKVELASENFSDPIRTLIKNWGQNTPSELALNITGVTINTSSLMSNRSILNSGRLSYPLNIPCGKVKALSFAEFIEMGYHYFTFDIHFAYKLVSPNRIKIDFTLNAPDIIHSQFAYYGSLPSELQKAEKVREDTVTTKKPAPYNIPELELHIDNFPLQRKLYSYCATKEHESLTDYVKNINPYPKAQLDQQTAAKFNLILNQEIVDALNNYQKDPQDLLLAIYPTGPITFDELKATDEGSVLNILRPKFRVNGKNITINFQWTTSDQLAKNVDPTKAPIITSEYRLLVPFEQLNSKALNKNIEVYTATGAIYKGLFKGVTGDYLYIKIQNDRGSSDTRFEKSAIRRVYVINTY